MIQLSVRETVDYLKEHNDYVIVTHRRPDGDTIGSAAALCLALRAYGKRAFVLENPQVTPKFRPLLEGLTTGYVIDRETLIAVDTATEGLLPDNAADRAGQFELLIDHHGKNTHYATRGFWDPGAAACGEMILRVVFGLGVSLTKRIGEAVYIALSTDTGCFRYGNTTSYTHRAAASCCESGADIERINESLFMQKSHARMKLNAYLIETTEFYADGLVAFSVIPAELREKLELTEDDLDDVAGFGREFLGVGIGVMVRQEGETGRVSVRTSRGYDAAAICAKLGGGGHKGAAAATIPGDIELVKKTVLRAIRHSGIRL